MTDTKVETITNTEPGTLTATHVFLPNGTMLHVIGTREEVVHKLRGYAIGEWLDLEIMGQKSKLGTISMTVPEGLIVESDHTIDIPASMDLKANEEDEQSEDTLELG